MNKYFVFVSFFFICVFVLTTANKNSTTQVNTPLIPCPTFPVKPPPSVRFLIIKHSRESMADMDANLAIHSIENASSKGLMIEVVGNYFFTSNDHAEFKKFIDEKMKINKKHNDTFIIHTIGHGFHDGNLQNLGNRAKIMKIIAEVAEDNNQRTLWWQLSCYACAGLPDIHDLPEGQQNLINVFASSPANEQSGTEVQARIMGKLFTAMADKNKELDPDGDNIITANEMKNYLNTLDRSNRGDLLFSKNQNTKLFGFLIRHTASKNKKW